MSIQTANKAAIWSNYGQRFRGYVQVGIGTSGSGEGNSPGPGKTLVYGTSEFYTPRAVISQLDPPGEVPSKEIEYYAQSDTEDQFLIAQREGRLVGVQERIYDGVSLSNPRGWTKLVHWGYGTVGNIVLGAPISREYSGAGVVNRAPINFEVMFELVRPTITVGGTPVLDVDTVDLTLVTEIMALSPFYPGPNRIAFAGLTAVTGQTAKVLSSSTGGSSWAQMTNAPFAADEDISAIAYKVLSDKRLRLFVGNGTAGAGSFQIAYVDLDFNDVIAGTFTVVTSTEGAVGDTVQAIGAREALELLVASDGKVYVSSDAGQTFAAALNPSGSVQINKIFYTPDLPQVKQYAYICGETNLLMRKPIGKNSIETLVGPEAATSLKAGAIARSGVLYQGSDEKLYRSLDGGETAGGWQLVYTFEDDVVGVSCVLGDEEVLIVATADGKVFISPDSIIFEEIEGPSSGYTGMVTSPYAANFALLYGASNGTNPTIDVLGA